MSSRGGVRRASSDAREQRVPRVVVLRGIRPSAREPAVENAEMGHLLDLELFPPVRCTAAALAADLKPEQGFDAMPDPVVMRLDNSRASGLVDELDDMLVENRTH